MITNTFIIISLIIIAIMLYLTPRDGFKSNKYLTAFGILVYFAFLFSFLLHAPKTNNFIWTDCLFMFIAFYWTIKRLYSLPLIQKTDLVEFEVIYRLLYLGLFGYFLLYRKISVNFSFDSGLKAWVFTIGITLAVLIVDVWVAGELNFLRFVRDKINWRSIFIIGVYMFFFVALAQEFLFRGLIYGYLAQFISIPGLPVLLSSVIFGLAHLNYAGWKMVIVATIAGLGYCLIYLLTGNLVCAMASHTAINLFWKLYMRRI